MKISDAGLRVPSMLMVLSLCCVAVAQYCEIMNIVKMKRPLPAFVNYVSNSDIPIDIILPFLLELPPTTYITIKHKAFLRTCVIGMLFINDTC